MNYGWINKWIMNKLEEVNCGLIMDKYWINYGLTTKKIVMIYG